MYDLILNEKRGKVLELPDLPIMPVLGQQILSQVTGEHVDIPRLAKTIEQDPAVFARIIGVANSAYFGCPDKIYTITHAIVRVLGLCMVKSLSLGMVLSRPLDVKACSRFDMQDYWFNSILTATVAQRLARYIKFGQKDFQDHAYLAGMLNNIGELILVKLFPSEMTDVYGRLEQNPALNELALQKEIIGINKYEASSILAGRWHLPSDLQTMYRNFEDKQYEGEHWQLLRLMRLCKILINGHDTEENIVQLEVQSDLDKLGLSVGQVKKLMKKIDNDRKDVEGLATIMVQE